MESPNPKQETNHESLLNQKPNNDKDHHHPPHQNSPSSSPLSSPSHEFSFTITLHPSPSSTPTSFVHKKPSPHSSSLALDLAPADDIFFHGHLLPLHLLSSLPPRSPARPSTDTICIENFHLPTSSHATNIHEHDPKDKKKSYNSLSSFFDLSKWFLKWSDPKKMKKAFDVKYYWKKYASMVEPLFASNKRGKAWNRDLRQRPYSFSGHSNPRERDKWVRRRGEFSAPASMRTSPTNSGLLLATPVGQSTSSESSMEELQNAIQAAIAHCKKSTASKEDLCKC